MCVHLPRAFRSIPWTGLPLVLVLPPSTETITAHHNISPHSNEDDQYRNYTGNVHKLLPSLTISEIKYSPVKWPLDSLINKLRRHLCGLPFFLPAPHHTVHRAKNHGKVLTPKNCNRSHTQFWQHEIYNSGPSSSDLGFQRLQSNLITIMHR